MVARRAKQLINGAKKMVDVDAENPLTIAIQEVDSGKVNYELMNDVNFYMTEPVDEDSDVEADEEAEEITDEEVVEESIEKPEKE